MKKSELIDLIASKEYKTLYDAEDDILSKVTCVASGLNLEDNGQYNTATNVYKTEDGFVGLRGAYMVDMENLSEEIYIPKVKAFPMEKRKTIIYVKSENV